MSRGLAVALAAAAACTGSGDDGGDGGGGDVVVVSELGPFGIPDELGLFRGSGQLYGVVRIKLLSPGGTSAEKVLFSSGDGGRSWTSETITGLDELAGSTSLQDGDGRLHLLQPGAHRVRELDGFWESGSSVVGGQALLAARFDGDGALHAVALGDNGRLAYWSESSAGFTAVPVADVTVSSAAVIVHPTAGTHVIYDQVPFLPLPDGPPPGPVQAAAFVDGAIEAPVPLGVREAFHAHGLRLGPELHVPAIATAETDGAGHAVLLATDDDGNTGLVYLRVTDAGWDPPRVIAICEVADCQLSVLGFERDQGVLDAARPRDLYVFIQRTRQESVGMQVIETQVTRVDDLGPQALVSSATLDDFAAGGGGVATGGLRVLQWPVVEVFGENGEQGGFLTYTRGGL